MKTLHSALKLRIETWEDPGDYPSGAGGGPLPSYKFVEGVDGIVIVRLEAEDVGNLEGDTSIAAIQAYLDDNAGEVDHKEPGLTVQKWDVVNVADGVVTLQVLEFEAEPPERDYE